MSGQASIAALPIDRVFLGWDAPAIVSISRWLLGPGANPRPGSDPGLVDLSDTLVVLAGSRGGRLLTTALVDGARANGRRLLPPRIVTTGRLVDELYPPHRPAATPTHSLGAWIAALRIVSRETVAAGLGRLPEGESFGACAAAAQRLMSVNDELGGELLNFGDVAKAAARFAPLDAERWDALATIQQRYLELLDSESLLDGAASRLERLRGTDSRAAGARRPRRIVLGSVAEMPRSARRALLASAEQAVRVDALIAAPAAISGQFDDLGCVLVDAWRQATLPLERAAWHIAESPEDQADLVLAGVAAATHRSSQEIAVCVPDAGLATLLTSRALRCGVRMRDAAGRGLGRSRVASLLRVLAEHLDRPSFSSMATLVRHADVAAMVDARLADGAPDGTQVSWLAALDAHQREHLPRQIAEPDPRPAEREGGVDLAGDGVVAHVVSIVRTLLRDLDGPADSRPLSAWAEPIAGVLGRLFGEEARADGLVRDAVVIALERLREIAAGVSTTALDPRATAGDAARLVAEALDAAAAPPPDDPDAIEMLGWLELALDDAPEVIVGGMNEGQIPAASRSPMLPVPLRAALGMATPETRFARDAFLLTTLLQTRHRVTLISGRRSAAGDPMMPSRLLFACGDGEIPARARAWLNPTPAYSIARPTPRPGAAATRSRVMPVPASAPVLAAMSVTWFKDYLASPYQFYLRHILRLEETGEVRPELDAPTFGSLVHDALRDFGRSALRDTTEPAEIESFLRESLAGHIRTRFGTRPPAAVRVQAEHAAARLAAAALVQAEQVRQGWRIAHVEWSPPASSPVRFGRDRHSIVLKGRIDRIDRHESGRFRVIDFKTFAEAVPPERTHHVGRADSRVWRDLQLPLYRHLAASVIGREAVEFAYFALPAKLDQTKLLVAQWTPADLADADSTAEDVIARVQRGDFREAGLRPRAEGVFGMLTGAGFSPTDATTGTDEGWDESNGGGSA